jgi:hypothetical protein
MKKLFIILSFLISLMCVSSQSWSLPDCPSSPSFNNCYGSFTWENGDKYIGEWKDNKKHRQGTQTWAIGDKYVGEWKDNKTHGQGTYSYPNGNKYVGESKNNKRNGQGTFTWAKSGNKYVGEWKDNKTHGQGTKTWADGIKYVGEWKDNTPHGQGTKTWADGSKYVGEWKDNKLTGEGILSSANGKIQEGIFKDNKFMYAKKIQKTEKKYAEVSKPNTSSKELDALKRQAEETKQKRKELERKLALLEKEKQSKKAIGTVKRQEEEEKQKIKKLEQQLALLKKEQQSKPKTIVKTEPKSEFSNKPINVNFKSITKRPDDIAVIIGNANYEKQGKDIPNVNPAYADSEGIKQYFMQALGVKEGNIIYLKDATAAQLLGTFGDSNSHKGQLYNWVKPQVSNVYVYYAGHGVPGGDKGNAYLVPTDANSQTIEFSGYPLSTLYSNLGKLSAKSITVILEACFSGASQAGNLFSKSSPIVIRAKKTMIPKNVKVISAGAVDQMASWEQDNSHGLFTKYFLKAMSGEGDKNNDGKVSDTELKDYLGETMTYYARRYYGRDQNVQIMQGN